MRASTSSNTVVLAMALALGLAGCASAGGSAGRVEGATANRIVRAELEPLGQITPLQAIDRLRPRWLQGRGGDTPNLHINGSRMNNVQDLNSYQLSDIEQMEFMSANDATTRFGTGYTGGVILVTTIR